MSPDTVTFNWRNAAKTVRCPQPTHIIGGRGIRLTPSVYGLGGLPSASACCKRPGEYSPITPNISLPLMFVIPKLRMYSSMNGSPSSTTYTVSYWEQNSLSNFAGNGKV